MPPSALGFEVLAAPPISNVSCFPKVLTCAGFSNTVCASFKKAAYCKELTRALDASAGVAAKVDRTQLTNNFVFFQNLILSMVDNIYMLMHLCNRWNCNKVHIDLQLKIFYQQYVSTTVSSRPHFKKSRLKISYLHPPSLIFLIKR